MKKEDEGFKKELEFVLSTKIFYKEPSNNRILLFSLIYIFSTVLGSSLGLYYLVSIFTLPILVYLLSARGNNYFFSITLLVSVATCMVSSLNALFWNIVHILLAVLIHRAIKYRYSKIFILLAISSFIFFTTTLYMHILFATSIVNYSPSGIQGFIDSYISQVASLQPTTDTELLREAFEQVKRYIPTMVFMLIVGYSLVLINYSFSFLSKEKAIVPIFPKLKYIAVGRSIAYVYMLLTFLLILMAISGLDFYNPYYLFTDNAYSIFRWIFVFNGVCTVFFFIEEKAESRSRFLKVTTVLFAYLFSGLFDIIGLVDSLTRLRGSYARLKGGK